ncbi:hypothetical protein [Streptomyces chartreusis]|uniref:Type IV secretion system protein n=1 Tax=Streptomyces chartreusis TaxID=1969 RepID=A0A7H8TA54_STRCX|nr:hypothetical protein [Streptomyces chartreusis]QKZ20375.1 hypothetical protein HUT05_25310 [Streptomyces chartreusis]
MRTNAISRAVLLLLALLLTFGVGGAAVPAYAADGDGDGSKVVVDYGPPEDPPKEWEEGGLAWGLTSDGNYCILSEYDDCNLDGGEHAGTTVKPCEGASGAASAACTKEEQRKFEEKALADWQEKNKGAENYNKVNDFLTQCVKKDHKPFVECKEEAAFKYPPPATDPLEWLAGKVSEAASDAMKEAARYVGESVVWLLEKFANAFNSWSTVSLADTGISDMLGISLTLSVVLAVFLLIIQFGKVAVSQDGGPFATAATGLAKFGAILAVYVTATQVALDWSDEVSIWIINWSFEGGGSGKADAAEAMQTQLGALFSALTVSGGAAAGGGALITGGGVLANAVAVIIVIGILCIIVIAGLWIEMMLRQAAIMILVATMPIVLAGQMADATRDWWPKARNALIATILAKPAIVLCFGIGFSAATDANGVRNVLVGFVVFVLAGAAWPVLARFFVFTPNGDGNSAASGIISSVGSSVSSMFGGYQVAPGGAGVIGGGTGYTRALEEDNASVASSGSNATGGTGFFSRVAGSVGLGLQIASVGKDTLESSAQNTAANAGLGPAASGGRHVVVPPARAAGGVSQSEPETPESQEDGAGGSASPGPAPLGEAGPAPSAPPAPPPPAAPPMPAHEPSTVDTTTANWHGPRPTDPREGS